MVRTVGALLLMLASGVALASPAVPTRLPGIGSPVAGGNAREVLRRYCQPIENWNLMAWQMCVDSGLLVNRAIRGYHQRGCASRAAPGGTKEAARKPPSSPRPSGWYRMLWA